MTITNSLARTVSNSAKSAATESSTRLFGAGHMPQYLFANAFKSGSVPFTLTASTESRTYDRIQEIKNNYPNARLSADTSIFGNMRHASNNTGLDTCVICVKPPIFKALSKEEIPQPFLNPDSLIVHMLAGTSSQEVGEKLGIDYTKIIRIMPNINAKWECGVVAKYLDKTNMNSSDPRVESFNDRLQESCLVIDVENEEALHGLTLAIGSLPAFHWEFTKRVESLTQAQIGSDRPAQINKLVTTAIINDVLAEGFRDARLNPAHRERILPMIKAGDDLPEALSELRNQVSDEMSHIIHGVRSVVLNENSETELIPEQDLNAAIYGSLIGSNRTYEKEDMSLSELQKKVRSKNGTTDAGLKVLEARGGATQPITEFIATETAIATLKKSKKIV